MAEEVKPVDWGPKLEQMAETLSVLRAQAVMIRYEVGREEMPEELKQKMQALLGLIEGAIETGERKLRHFREVIR